MDTISLAFVENLMRPQTLLLLLIVGVLVYGRRLPEVGRGLGRSIVEFRKGLKGIEDDVRGDLAESDRAAQLPKRDTVGAARPPLTSTGEDARVARPAPPIERIAPEQHPEPM
jgi:sec-independent protein translocase protein TatA